MGINEFRARSSGDDVAAGFMKWARANTSMLALGDPLPVLRTFLENHRTTAKTEVDTALEPFAAQVALGKYFFDHPEEDFSFARQVVMGYLLYLDDSDPWSGSDQLFEGMQEALLESEDEQSDADFEDRVFEVPALSRTQTRNGLLALPLARRLQSFIEVFGGKRDVTAKGLLTREDIEGTAAALRVATRGVHTDPSIGAEKEGDPCGSPAHWMSPPGHVLGSAGANRHHRAGRTPGHDAQPVGGAHRART